MLPSKRGEGASHEVASFDTIESGVAYFTLTLNSHPACQLLRDLRAALKAKGEPFKGWDLVAGLLEYSERREAYVDGIREMITSNNLHRFTRVKYDY